MPTSLILDSSGLAYTYPGGSTIAFPDLGCAEGGQLLITGDSGKGKTTLLHLLSGLLKVQQGKVILSGEDLSKMNQRDLDRFRGKHVGLVFQQARFVQSLTVIQNVMASQYFGTGGSDEKSALALLEELDISRYASKFANRLSGGERQRLSIAMALASQPDLVLADEPTSSLDDTNTDLVYRLLEKECSAKGVALVVVSHDRRLKAKFKDVVQL